MSNSKVIWEQAWAAEQPLFKQYAQLERLMKYRHVIGNVATENLILGENGWVRGFFSKKSYKKIQIDGKRLLNPRIVKKHTRGIKNLLKDFWTTAAALRKLLQKKENLFSRKFLKLSKKFDELVIKLFAYILTTWEAPSYYPEQELQKRLKSFYPSNWREKYITLITPSEPDLLLKEKN